LLKVALKHQKSKSIKIFIRPFLMGVISLCDWIFYQKVYTYNFYNYLTNWATRALQNFETICNFPYGNKQAWKVLMNFL
jgi:hypothetical protein